MNLCRAAVLVLLALCATITGCAYSMEAYEAHGPDTITSPDTAMLCTDGRRVQFWNYSKPDLVKGTHKWSQIRDGDRLIEDNYDNLRWRIVRYSRRHNDLIAFGLSRKQAGRGGPFVLNQVRVICVEPMICVIQPEVAPTDLPFPQYGTRPVETDGLLWFSPDADGLPTWPAEQDDRLTIPVDWGWIYISKSTGEITALAEADLPPEWTGLRSPDTTAR